LDENFLVFHYADRIKAFIIEALRILDFYLELEGSEELEKLMLQILNSCKKEVSLAKSICYKINWARPYLTEASLKIKDGINYFVVENHDGLKENFRLALSKMTTCAAKAQDRMEDKVF